MRQVFHHAASKPCEGTLGTALNDSICESSGMTIALETTVQAGAAAHPRVNPRDETITVLLVAWTIIGLWVDVWSHTHLAKLESFFTPWHALFYSGFLATVAWMVRPMWRARVEGRGEIPATDRISFMGIVIFTAGALCDMVWHTVYGLEAGFAALISPPHQFIFFGLMLMASAPFRRAWCATGAGTDEPALRSFLPAVISLGMTMTVVTLVIGYLWKLAGPDVFTLGREELIAAQFGQNEQTLVLVREMAQDLAIGRTLVTTVLLMAPALLVLRRWRPPFGTITLVWAVVGTATGAVSVLWYFPVLVLTGLFADWLAGTPGIFASRIVRIRTFSAAVPFVLWGSYFLLTHRNFGLAWSPGLWLGTMMLASTAGLGLSLLVFPNAPYDGLLSTADRDGRGAHRPAG